MKRNLFLCPIMILLSLLFSSAVFADSEAGYVSFTRNGNIYADVSETVSLEQNAVHTAVSNITIAEDETVDISVKQNMMFYNNSTQLGFFGYTIKTKNNNSNGNVQVTLYKGSETLASSTVDKTTFASAVNGIYVAGSTTVKIIYAPDCISVYATGSTGTAALIENAAISGRNTTGDITITSGGTSANNRKLYSVKISSGSAEVKRTSFLMNKKFTVSDNYSALAADKYSITGADTYCDLYGISRHNTSGKLSVFYKGVTFGGAYTLEVVGAKAHNDGYVYFNYTDSSNCYVVNTKSTSSTSATLKIQKKVNGVSTSLLTDDEGNIVETKSVSMGTNGRMKYIVNLNPDAQTGNLNITLTMINANDVTRTITVTDVKTDTYSPMTSGYVGYENSYVNVSSRKINYVKSIKVYPGTSAQSVAGVFKNDGTETNEYIPGKTTFGFPVSLIGEDPVLMAAVYNGDRLQGVKKLDFSQANSGDVNISDELGNKVKVYMLESLAGIRPIGEHFEIPKTDEGDNGFIYTQTAVVEDNYYDAYSSFYQAAKIGAVVPGLSEDIVPQGLAYRADKNQYYISGYAAEGEDSSVIMVIDAASKKYVGEYYLNNSDGSKFKGHVGGIAITKDNLFVASGKKLCRISLSEIDLKDGCGDLYFEEIISLSIGDGGISFCNYSDGVLWIGNFYEENDYPSMAYDSYKALTIGYILDEATDNDFKASSKADGQSYDYIPDYICEIPEKIQGITTIDGLMVLSQSYGRKNISTLRIGEAPVLAGNTDQSIVLGDVTIPVSKFTETKSITAMPMSEGIANDGSNVVILFESGAKKYREGGGTGCTDRLWSLNVSDEN